MASALRHKPGAAAWIGLALGPLAWAASQQVGYLLAGLACGPTGWRAILAVNGVAALLALAGAALCWHARRHGGADEGESRAERGFVGGMGAALGLLFATVIVAQALAGLFFQACER